MSHYCATIKWQRNSGEIFTDNRYSRAHEWIFDGGLSVPASASPQVVPVPFSVSEYVDPEEAFIASLSSCHMLWFLSLAARDKLIVDSYSDDAIGVMEKNAEGKMAITTVTLQPAVIFDTTTQPTPEKISALHHEAHDRCFIANSVKSDVRVLPQ